MSMTFLLRIMVLPRLHATLFRGVIRRGCLLGWGIVSASRARGAATKPTPPHGARVGGSLDEAIQTF